MLLQQERSKRSSGLGLAQFLAIDDIDYPLHFILRTFIRYSKHSDLCNISVLNLRFPVLLCSAMTHLRVRLWYLILFKWLYQTRSVGLTGYSDLSVLQPLRHDLGT
jgi:hypothetical protein